MKIYMFVDAPELGEKEAAAIEALQAWVGEDNPHATFVDNREGVWKLGIELEMKKPKFLTAPLNDMYAFAKDYKCNFVVGYIDNNTYEDVCYFGKDEGKPDPFAIACYLGFE